MSELQTSVDLVVTRYRENVGWLSAYASRPDWRVFLYNTGPRLPPRHLCRQSTVSCTRVDNAGFEWHGYLRYLIDHYDALAATTIFLQANPETVSPDVHCLLNQTDRYKPVQPLSWVQQAKRRMPLFSECRASYLGGCRVWVEPVTAGLRPMLHGDRWLHRGTPLCALEPQPSRSARRLLLTPFGRRVGAACRMAKRMRGGLFQFLPSQHVGHPPPVLLEDSAPPACLDHPEAWGALARLGAPPRQLGGSPWPPQLASALLPTSFLGRRSPCLRPPPGTRSSRATPRAPPAPPRSTPPSFRTSRCRRCRGKGKCPGPGTGSKHTAPRARQVVAPRTTAKRSSAPRSGCGAARGLAVASAARRRPPHDEGLSSFHPQVPPRLYRAYGAQARSPSPLHLAACLARDLASASPCARAVCRDACGVARPAAQLVESVVCPA